MQKDFTDHNNSSTELILLEALISDQNQSSDQATLPINAINSIRKYVDAREAVLILFDPENPDWANKKLLGEERTWKSESAFLLKDSLLCSSMAEEMSLIEYDDFAPDPTHDPVLCDPVLSPIHKLILAPLRANTTNLGAIVFLNPSFDLNNSDRFRFLQVIVKALANAIHTAARNQQLIVSNADLEATYWQILNSRNTLRTFFDNIPSSVYIVDRAYTILAINSPRSERVGKKPQELVGEKCYEKLHGHSTPCAECHVMDALNGISSVRAWRELGPNETFVHWEITTVPIREISNVINQVIVFEEDVTEKWILEANLIQSEKMASIGQLAANVAHEINNPLAAIIANAQLLLRDLADADENTIDSLRLIETAGDRAAKIVSNLLESARRDKHYEFEEVSLNETILDAISLLRYEINKRSVTINLDLSREIPFIFANKNQLKGVWINLINNALGAIDSDRGAISISSRFENKEFYLVFADNGKGILPQHQARIFEPFFTTKEAGKGTGLGLSVSLQVIKEHLGSIEVESTPGEGTKFIIILPEIDKDLL
jgi:two-component system NtrC family sensor kinase